MEIIIDIEDPDPLFSQLVGQIKQAVQAGKLSAGDPLPSIRQLATDLELNSKTVAKAYRLLERDSVIQTRGYRGTFVHPDAKANSTVDLNAWVMRKLNETIAAFRESGVTDSEIRIAFGNVMNDRSNAGA
jgi:GntR family transcriptional regulator